MKPFSRALLLAAFLLLFAPAYSLGQGCTQCRDNTAATPPKTQAAYRHAIILMVITAGTLFVGTVLLIRKSS